MFVCFTAFLDRKVSTGIRSMTDFGNTVSFWFPILSYSLALCFARVLVDFWYFTFFLWCCTTTWTWMIHLSYSWIHEDFQSTGCSIIRNVRGIKVSGIWTAVESCLMEFIIVDKWQVTFFSLPHWGKWVEKQVRLFQLSLM